MTEYSLSDTQEFIKDLIAKNKELKVEVGKMNTLLNITNGLLREMPSVAEYQRGYEDGFREGRTRREMSEERDEEMRAE